MKRIVLITALIFLICGTTGFSVEAGEVPGAGETRPHFLETVNVSPDGKWLVMSYQEDIVLMGVDGQTPPFLLTRDSSSDIAPVWSPDGSQIAFSSDREGNYELFVVSRHGGLPRQITFHSANDYVCSWSKNGRIIFRSGGRDTMGDALYSIEPDDGSIELLTPGFHMYNSGSLSPDDSQSLLYTRGPYGWDRKGFTGPADNEIWLKDFTTGRAQKFTDNEFNEHYPIWSPNADAVYFVSELSGMYQLWKREISSGIMRQITHMDSPVASPSISADGHVLVFVSGYRLFRLDPTADTDPQEIPLSWELDSIRPIIEYMTFPNKAISFSLSPNSKRIAVEIFGQIYNLATDEGKEIRLSTGSGESRNKFPQWQPGGGSVAFLSDTSGNDELYVIPAAGGPARKLTDTPEDESFARWSPDGKKIAVIVAMHDIVLYDLESGKARKLAAGCSLDSLTWSPDGRWIFYIDYDDPSFSYLIDINNSTVHNLTRDNNYYGGGSFSPDGKRLYVSCYYGLHWNDSDIFELPLTRGIEKSADDILDPGFNGDPVPPAAPGHPPRTTSTTVTSKGRTAAAAEPESSTETIVDFFEIGQRLKPLLKFPGTDLYPSVCPTNGDLIAFLSEREEAEWLGEPSRILMLYNRREANEPEALTDLEPITSYTWSSDGTQIYYCSGGTIKHLTLPEGKPEALNTSVSFPINRNFLDRQKYLEFTRLIKNYYADPDLRGRNIGDIIARHQPLLVDTVSTRLFKDLVWQSIGELDSSHIYIMGSSSLDKHRRSQEQGFLGMLYRDTPEGLLVAHILANGVVHRSGQDLLKPGDRIISINATPVKRQRDLYRLLNHTMGKDISLTWVSKDKKTGEQTVTLRPDHFGDHYELLYNDWVRLNREKVTTSSGGDIGYIHVKEMEVPSFLQFEHDFVGQMLGKKGLIIDVRNNPGGYTSQYFIDVFRRLHSGYEFNRNGKKHLTPVEVWNRPLVLLINEYSFSDAEILPFSFRANKLGTIIGMPTSGAVIGISMTHKTVDGLVLTIPGNAWFSLDNENLEEMCIKPDIEIDLTETDIQTGLDTQLETAVSELLKQSLQK